MQENSSQNQGINENMAVPSLTNQKSTSPILYILTGFGVAVVAFGLGYLVRGYSVNEYIAEEIIVPEPMVQEETVTPLAMMEEEPAEANLPSTIVENGDYVYTNKELGFSITLPEIYNVLSEEIRYDKDANSVSFYLPIKSLSETYSENLFVIVRFNPGADISQSGPGGQKIMSTNDGYQYYFYLNGVFGMSPENPEYDVYMSLDPSNVYTLVKDGFKLL